MPNLKFYKSTTEPTDAELGSIWFSNGVLQIKTDSGWETIANKNTIEHIFVRNREYPAKAVEGIKLDPIENGVQLPESPYLVTQEDDPEIYEFFNTFLTNAVQASASGKTATGYELSSAEQSTIIEKIKEIPRCFILDSAYNLGVFFWSDTGSDIYVNCLPGHYVLGSNSHKLTTLTAKIGMRLVEINIYKNFTPTTSGDGTKYLNDKGEYDSEVFLVGPNDDYTSLNKTNAEIYSAYQAGKIVILKVEALNVMWYLVNCYEETAYFIGPNKDDDGDGHVKYYLNGLKYSGETLDSFNLDYITSKSLSSALQSKASVIELSDAKINAFQNFKVGDSITTESIDVLFLNSNSDIQLCYNTGSYQDGTWYLKEFTSGSNTVYGCYRIFSDGYFYCELTTKSNNITAVNRGTKYFDNTLYVEMTASGYDNDITYTLSSTYSEIAAAYVAGRRIDISMPIETSKLSFIFIGNLSEDGIYYFMVPMLSESDQFQWWFALRPDNTVRQQLVKSFSGNYNDLTNKPDLTLSWTEWS